MCNESNYIHGIDSNFNKCIAFIRSCAMQISGVTRSKWLVVPGWSTHVKELHGESRRAFLTWRFHNSPRSGPLTDAMRRTLRGWMAEEDAMRAEALSAKTRSFWREVYSSSPQRHEIARRVDVTAGERRVAELWRGKCNEVLNSIDDRYKHVFKPMCSGRLWCR